MLTAYVDDGFGPSRNTVRSTRAQRDLHRRTPLIPQSSDWRPSVSVTNAPTSAPGGPIDLLERMVERIPVLCENCGRPYCARLVDDEVLVPTTDGRCRCGAERFVEVEHDEGPDDSSVD